MNSINYHILLLVYLSMYKYAHGDSYAPKSFLIFNDESPYYGAASHKIEKVTKLLASLSPQRETGRSSSVSVEEEAISEVPKSSPPSRQPSTVQPPMSQPTRSPIEEQAPVASIQGLLKATKPLVLVTSRDVGASNAPVIRRITVRRSNASNAHRGTTEAEPDYSRTTEAARPTLTTEREPEESSVAEDKLDGIRATLMETEVSTMGQSENDKEATVYEYAAPATSQSAYLSALRSVVQGSWSAYDTLSGAVEAVHAVATAYDGLGHDTSNNYGCNDSGNHGQEADSNNHSYPAREQYIPAGLASQEVYTPGGGTPVAIEDAPVSSNEPPASQTPGLYAPVNPYTTASPTPSPHKPDAPQSVPSSPTTPASTTPPPSPSTPAPTTPPADTTKAPPATSPPNTTTSTITPAPPSQITIAPTAAASTTTPAPLAPTTPAPPQTSPSVAHSLISIASSAMQRLIATYESAAATARGYGSAAAYGAQAITLDPVTVIALLSLVVYLIRVVTSFFALRPAAAAGRKGRAEEAGLEEVAGGASPRAASPLAMAQLMEALSRYDAL